MINLYPWRLCFFYRAIILVMVIAVVTSVLSMFVFVQFYWAQEKVQFRLQHQRQLLSAQTDAVGVQVLQKIKLINAIIWQRNHYVMKIINLLQRLPESVVLSQIQCKFDHCELSLDSERMDALSKLFKNEQEINIKQGVCPRCYHANIGVTLSN